jgi:hypothetical protein
MKTIKNTFFVILIASIFTSCSKDDAPDFIQRFDRNITFKIVGNYSGTLNVVYANPNNEFDPTPGEILTTFPWQKNLNYSKNVRATVFTVGGQNGAPNETLQLQVFSNGELIETELGITDDQGRISAETSFIYFKL